MSQFRTDDGQTLAYRVHGEGERTVLLVHGWMTSSIVWYPFVEHLQPGVRYVALDLRGSGDSDRPGSGYTLERYARDVLALADHLGLDRFGVVGHSMGGQISQLVAILAPDRVDSLALFSAVPACGVSLPDDAHQLFFGSGENAELQGTILDIASPGLSPADRARLVEAAGSVPTACIQGAYAAWTGGGFVDRLGSIPAPTLVVAGDDPFLPPAFLQAEIVDRLERARLAVLPGTGHYIQVERPAESAALVDAFYAGLG